MKKLLALALCIASLFLVGVLITSAANIVEEAGYYMVKSEKTDEILAGKAGEEDILWEVPYLHIPPTLDGQIDKAEYYPFEMYEDYLSWLANSTDPTTGEIPNTREDFQLFYDATQEGFFKPWWGWDGNYLYLAFEVNLVNGFTCTPEVMGGDMMLWAYNCLQVGLSPADATGTDGYTELGFGVHSETNEPITFNWFGTYCPVAGEDFNGYYDEQNQLLRYEMRIHLPSVLELDRTVENGDTMNLAWVLSLNGETTGTYDVWHLFFCHGISGPHSKNAANMARVTFAGKPIGDDGPIVNIIPGMSEEDKALGLKETVDLSNETVVKTFEGENAGVEYITEGDESFMRITSFATEGYPYVYSTKYPRNIVGGLGDYVVVKYRTSSEMGEDLGIIFRNVFDTEFHPDDCYVDTIGTDGEWHVTIFYMTGENNWQHFILNLGFVPFALAENSAQETLDLAWIKFYQEDPSEMYYHDFYDPDAEEESEEESASSGETEPESEPDSTPAESVPVESQPAESQSADSTPAESKPAESDSADGSSAAESESGAEEKSGCGATVLGSVAVLMTGAAAAVVLKKKED